MARPKKQVGAAEALINSATPAEKSELQERLAKVGTDLANSAVDKTKSKPEVSGAVSSIDYIKPLIKVDGEQHILQEMAEAGDEPVMKAVGYHRIGDSKAGWISYVITFKGNKIISIEVDEPTPRYMVEESSKINYVRTFIDQE